MRSPYPSHLVREVRLRDGANITIRPIRPEDAAIETAFVRELSEESRYYRFMDLLRELPPNMLTHFTEVDYDRHMALIVTALEAGAEKQIAVARYVLMPDGRSCEFAIVVADAWQRRGVATLLMLELLSAARARGIERMFGEVLPGNHKMLAFTHKLGFSAAFQPDDMRLMRVEKLL